MCRCTIIEFMIFEELLPCQKLSNHHIVVGEQVRWRGGTPPPPPPTVPRDVGRKGPAAAYQPTGATTDCRGTNSSNYFRFLLLPWASDESSV